MKSIALNINNITKVYKNGFKALDNVSFQVFNGEFFGLLGPNGAGKTTLISSIAGLSKPTSGSIQVLGFDTKKNSHLSKMNLGIVPQELTFDPFFTVKEVLSYQSGYYGIKNNDQWIEEILEELGLLTKINNNTRSLSGGMKRRLMIAQALVHKPPVIILDEPTAGVDVELRQSLWIFIKKLNQQGHTIILTTHYLEEAKQLCDRILFMKQGQLIALDKTENLLVVDEHIHVSFICHENIKPLLSCLRHQHQKNKWLFELDNYLQLENLLHIINANHITISGLEIIEKNLEKVFLSLTQ
ncbi:MAG: ATP-binding cassette domain-containing protein [Neisseriaceae bacterium]|nr:MAG: ATP-binding cassette domain-containing protein [Neisseriaceae bacterium]